ncbi:hypothetical protein PCAR4_460100 [Paraburkholderia caribensis]|nr:hypothetical protein PCAR4_460100 [Paraburkholderia caribensis]
MRNRIEVKRERRRCDYMEYVKDIGRLEYSEELPKPTRPRESNQAPSSMRPFRTGVRNHPAARRTVAWFPI